MKDRRVLTPTRQVARWGTAASLLKQYGGRASSYSAGRAPTGDEDDGSGKAEDFQARHEPVGQSVSSGLFNACGSHAADVATQACMAWHGMAWHGMAWHGTHSVRRSTDSFACVHH